MGAVYFYQLSDAPLESVLPVLVQKSRANGWKVVVRGVDPQHMDWLDQKLWLGPEDGFLPHGLAGGAHDAVQPVLLTTGMDTPNTPDCIISVGGAAVEPAEVEKYQRVSVVFDGNDQDALALARTRWKSLVDAGCAAQYWARGDTGWQMKAERAAASTA
jgi:DNA polymerase-3 subunit chi